MKAALILNSDSYFYPKPLHRFLLDTKHEVVMILIAPAFTNTRTQHEYAKVSMDIMGYDFGLKYFFALLFKGIGAFIPFLKYWIPTLSIESVARHHQISYAKLRSVNEPSLLECLHRSEASVVLSLCSQIYSKKTLSESVVRFYNVHPSLLPSNRGRFPIFWGVLNEDSHQGVTCHEITPEIDRGPIIFQELFTLKGTHPVPHYLEEYTGKCPQYLEKALSLIERNEKDLLRGLETKSFYGPTPNSAEIRRYHSLLQKSAQI